MHNTLLRVNRESVIKEVRVKGKSYRASIFPWLSSSVFSADEISLLFMLKIRMKLG